MKKKENGLYPIEGFKDGNGGGTPPLSLMPSRREAPMPHAGDGPAGGHPSPSNDEKVVRYHFTRAEAREAVRALEEEIVFLIGLYQEAGVPVPRNDTWMDISYLIQDPQPVDIYPVGMCKEDPCATGGRIG